MRGGSVRKSDALFVFLSRLGLVIGIVYDHEITQHINCIMLVLFEKTLTRARSITW